MCFLPDFYHFYLLQLQVEVYMSPSATGRRGVKSKESSIPSDRFSILRMDASNINAVVILGGPGSAPQREQKIDAHQILQRNLRCKEVCIEIF